MAAITVDLDSMSRDELEALNNTVRAKLESMRVLEDTVDAVEQLAARYLDHAGRGRGEEWVQPTGAHDAYPQGWTVTHDGKQWESLTPANVWEPGVSGWRETTPDGGGPAEWVQPTGAHDAYKKGDRITYRGTVWRSTIDGNVWAPGVYGWEQLT